MADKRSPNLMPARIGGLAVTLCGTGIFILLSTVTPVGAAPPDDHQKAVAALMDVKAAISDLVRADASYSTDRESYRGAARRAINRLAGEHDGATASPTGESGAIGHIDALLDRKDNPVWTAPLHGAEANIRAAVAYLQESTKARELTDYQIASSRALTYLEVARGRPTEAGVLGGLEGALANTVLGVPAGASQLDACRAPSAAPAYGTHNGYIAWVTVPGGDGLHTLAEATGGTELAVRGGYIVLHTAAASQVTTSCNSHAEAAAQPAADVAADTSGETPAPSPAEAAPQPQVAANTGPRQPAAAPSQTAAQPAASPPPLYTEAQAEQGAHLFAEKCVACHGTNLQGTAAPSVAGNDFLRTAKQNGWTLAMIRYLVVNNMPMNAPSSLTPAQYASVLAFLLASNCYPAGGKPFPTSADPAFANVKLGPLPNPHPGENEHGVCPVK